MGCVLGELTVTEHAQGHREHEAPVVAVHPANSVFVACTEPLHEADIDIGIGHERIVADRGRPSRGAVGSMTARTHSHRCQFGVSSPLGSRMT